MLAFIPCAVNVCGCSSHRFCRNKQHHKITCWVFYEGNAKLSVWSPMLNNLEYPLPSSQPLTCPFSNLLCGIEHYSAFDRKYLLSGSPKNCLWSSLLRGWWLLVHPPQRVCHCPDSSRLSGFVQLLWNCCVPIQVHIAARLRGPSRDGWSCAGQRMMLQTSAVLL